MEGFQYLASAVAVGGAIFLAYRNNDRWGWFVVAAIFLS